MDDEIQRKFIREHGLSQDNIKSREDLFKQDILPFIRKRYLSHLVSTIEDLINGRQKEDFLEAIRISLGQANQEYSKEQYKAFKSAMDSRQLRLFSIILAPVDNGKVKARTYFIKGCALIAYWKDLEEKQKRTLIAHELGHIINKYVFEDTHNPKEESLATLFGFIAMCDKDKFYKTEASKYVYAGGDMRIYDEITALC